MTTTARTANDALAARLDTTLAARDYAVNALRNMAAIEAKGTKVDAESRRDLIDMLAYHNRTLASLGYAGM